MRALFLRHDPGSGPGMVGELLAERGFAPDVLAMSPSLVDGAWHGSFPDPLDYDLIVPLGAVWSLYDRSMVGSWIDGELALLRRADAHGVPVLGICFGGQALAAAHGGEVMPAARKELGWIRVDSDDPARVPPGPWMQWHSDRFVLPPGAQELARNEVCPQAFTLRRNLGVQFHPEVDLAAVETWLDLGGEEAADEVRAAGLEPDALLATTREQQDRARADLTVLLDAFLDEVATA